MTEPKEIKQGSTYSLCNICGKQLEGFTKCGCGPKELSFEQLLEREANERFKVRFGKATIADDFKAGVQWTLENLEKVPRVEKLLKVVIETNEWYKQEFHNDVCKQSRGCHCSITSIDKAIAEFKGEK